MSLINVKDPNILINQLKFVVFFITYIKGKIYIYIDVNQMFGINLIFDGLIMEWNFVIYLLFIKFIQENLQI